MHHPHHSDPILPLHGLAPVAPLVLGVVLLLFGRKLFWLFVGALGFLVGADAAATLFPHQPGWELIAGVVLGLLGMAMALLLQKVAIAIGGFFAGGYLAVAVLRILEMPTDGSTIWVAYLVGGIIGAILMYAVFNWALIIFSSISGAHLIVYSTAAIPPAGGITFLVIALVGIFFQARLLSGPPPREAV